jgi:hypothetical protein
MVSGILADQGPEIVDAFGRAGLYPIRQRECEGWLAIGLRQPQSCQGASR